MNDPAPLPVEWFGTIAASHAVPTGEKIGLPIVFVHGAWAKKEMFVNWQKFCAENGYESYAIDLRGHGQSPYGYIGNVSMNDYADDVEKVILAVGPCILFGSSMSGLLAQLVASRNKNVRKTVLISSMPPAGIIVMNALFMRMLRYVPRMILRKSITITRKEALVFLGDRLPAELYEQICPESGRALGEIGFWRIWIKSILCPVLVVAGGRDRGMPPSRQKKIAQKYGADFIEFKNAGHMMELEPEWQEPIAHILEWLAK